jgi:hypothetical protein
VNAAASAPCGLVLPAKMAKAGPRETEREAIPVMVRTRIRLSKTGATGRTGRGCRVPRAARIWRLTPKGLVQARTEQRYFPCGLV